MPIMLDLAGMPVEVAEPRINDFRKLGYRLPPEQEAEFNAIASSSEPTSDRIAINSASLKALIALAGITTAIAKKVIAQRPYQSVEDLIAKLPEVNWIDLEAKLSFDAAE